MNLNESPERFTIDLARLAPDWPTPSEREAEWARLVGHYLPRLREYFARYTGDPDLADDVVSHVLRRAVLKLHEVGSPHAAWEWFRTTGRNHLTDLGRRRPGEAARLAAYARDQGLEPLAEEPAAPDLMARVTQRCAPGDPDGGRPDDASGDGTSLGGRIPIDRPTWEARLAALTDVERQLLQLVEIEGATHAEAARRLGLPSPAASRKRHSRLRHFLRTGARAP